MQCIEISRSDRVVTIANAGHPYPVRYSARRRACDVLEVRGPLLHDVTVTHRQADYEQRHVEMEEGDLLIMMTDGLTEGGRLDGNAYGYRFVDLVTRCSTLDPQTVCATIVDDWRRHQRDESSTDDVAVLVVRMPMRSQHAH